MTPQSLFTHYTGDLSSAMPALVDGLNRANIACVMMLRHPTGFSKWDANDVAMRALGYSSRDEWLTTPTFGLLVPEQREVAARLYERLLAGDPLAPSIEMVFADKHGQPVPVEVSYGHAEIAAGNVLVLIWTDRAGYLPLQLSTLEADRVSLVGALAAGFAHETNNPLTSVLLNLRSLRKLVLTSLADAKQTAALRVLDDIATGAERIASNVRAFQTLASRGGGGPVDLAAVTSAVLRLAMPTLEPRAHVVREIFPVPPVAGDESRIGQAVLAMLLFAVSGFARAGDPSNQIVVAVAERDAQIVVVVSDNGNTLAPDELNHVFDPFFRSTGRGAGVGGGLAIARSVAISIGGEIAAAPQSNGGVAVTMRLPPAPPSPA